METSQRTHVYLKSEQYYYDLYDRFTIERCKNFSTNVGNSPKWNEEKDDKKREIMKQWAAIVMNVAVECMKGDRYTERETTVQKWIQEDKAKDTWLENAQPPKDIYCTYCNSLMNVELRELGIEDEKRVLFMYRCPRCNKGRAFYDNGDEWHYEPPNCPKCSTQYKAIDKTEGRRIITLFTCPRCDYHEETVLDLNEKHEPEPILPISEVDRKEYCLSDKDGQTYISQRYQLKSFSDQLKKDKEKEENKELYAKVAKIKRLKIAELEKLLSEEVSKAKCQKFALGKPDLGRYVSVDFSTEDEDAHRQEFEAKQTLKKALEMALADTNWRLMSDGISYRVGILTGRLRCYEKEED